MEHKFYGDGTPMCHYTRIEALDSILREEGVVLRAKNNPYFVDNREINEGIDLLRKIMAENEGNSKRDKEINAFINKISKPYFRNYHITSFCENMDDKYMWNNYAGGDSGCILIFNFLEIKKVYEEYNQHSFFEKCFYRNDECPHIDFLKLDIYGNTTHMPPSIETGEMNMHCAINTYTQNAIAKACLATKHSGFVCENEWRGVVYETNNVITIQKGNSEEKCVEVTISPKALMGIKFGGHVSIDSMHHVRQLLIREGIIQNYTNNPTVYDLLTQ